MLTLREQLQHKPFRLWMAKSPRLRNLGTRPPWVVYVQRQMDGPWARARFMDYQDAYRYVAKHLRDFHDIALNCQRQSFQPPVVRVAGGARKVYSPAPADFSHSWCGYCRRMTQFQFFINGKHPAIEVRIDASTKRCVICGVRQGFLRPYRILNSG